MERGKSSTATSSSENEEAEEGETHIPPGLTRQEFQVLKPIIEAHHTYRMSAGQCYSILAQRIYAPVDRVWSVVRHFDRPQVYKHFIKNCVLRSREMTVGCLREVNVISGLPANTSTERLDILDDDHHVTGFSIIGGEHRLRNYRSVTSVTEFSADGKIWTVVLESYVVDVPEGNTEEDTRMFADTVVRLNLQKLKSVTEGRGREDSGRSGKLSWNDQIFNREVGISSRMKISANARKCTCSDEGY